MADRVPDRIAGSVDLLEEAAGRIKGHLDRRGTVGLRALLDELVDEHPSMALRINLSEAMASAMSSGREAAGEALEKFLVGVIQGRLRTAAAFAALVHERGWKRVATTSRSGQVRECLASARHAGLEAVLLSEGRPAGEGILMARELLGEGLGVTITTDAALFSLLPSVDAVVVGVDACFGEAFANKVGTAALLREARAHGVPTVALMVFEKHLEGSAAARWRNLPLDRPSGLGKVPKAIEWSGELFERVPWDLVTHPLC